MKTRVVAMAFACVLALASIGGFWVKNRTLRMPWSRGSECVVSVDTGGKQFEADDGFSAAADDIHGTVTVFINENPVAVINRSGLFFSVDGFLKEGTNTLGVKGGHSLPLYLKVGLLGKTGGYKCLGRLKKAPATAEDSLVDTHFSISRSSPPTLFETSVPTDKEMITGELLKAIADLHRSFRQHDREAMETYLSAPYDLWANSVYDCSKEEYCRDLPTLLDHLASAEVEDLPLEDVRLLFGRNLVLAYRQFALQQNDIQPRTPPIGLFKYSVGDEVSFFPSVAFAHINGRWVPWSNTFE